MPDARGFRNTLMAVWPVGSMAGLLYAYFNSIPFATAAPLLAALLIEISLYLVLAFDGVRARLEQRFSPAALAGLMTLSALPSYLLAGMPPRGFFLLIVLAASLSFWYVVLPKSRLADLLFVAFAATVILSRVLQGLYLSPAEVLGQLMWIRLGVFAALSLRRVEGTGFGFLPTRRDWRIGVLHFLYFAPIGAAVGLAVRFFSFEPRPHPRLLLVFFGMLWVVALSEEFFFRGLLQRWLGEWLASDTAGLVIASILFGLAHLPFRQFPNWRFAILAAIAGFFYGRAYLKAGSIRAAMVAHALVNTTWRLLFS